jgi:26S proteasome regulatory subunit N7
MFKLSVRDFQGAVQLLVDSLATFASSELMEYKSLVKYVILAACLTLPRPELKSKVIDAPEILEVLHELPHLGEFAVSLYECNYSVFYRSLGTSSLLCRR